VDDVSFSHNGPRGACFGNIDMGAVLQHVDTNFQRIRQRRHVNFSNIAHRGRSLIYTIAMTCMSWQFISMFTFFVLKIERQYVHGLCRACSTRNHEHQCQLDIKTSTCYTAPWRSVTAQLTYKYYNTKIKPYVTYIFIFIHQNGREK